MVLPRPQVNMIQIVHFYSVILSCFYCKLFVPVVFSGDESGAVAIYSGRATDFPVGSPLSQIQPLDAFVFAGPGNEPSANLTETLIPGRQPYQLSNRQETIINTPI